MDVNTTLSLISAVISPTITCCALIPAFIVLFFTFGQMREATKQTKNLERTLRTSVYQEMVAGERDLFIAFFLEHPDMLDWYLRTLGFEIKGETENRLKLFYVLRFDFQESMYLQYQEGLLSEKTYAGWKRVLEVSFSKKITQEVWAVMGQYYTLPFRAFIDNEIIPISKKIEKHNEDSTQ
jgi:hypothetical protein